MKPPAVSTELRRHLRRLWVSVALLGSVILVGIIGFVVLEGYNLLDAVYMTVITITTVGFHEVQPLDAPGKLFATLLIIANISIFAYFVSTTTQLLFEGQLRGSFRIFRMHKRIEKLAGHTLVIGYGRIGRRVTEELLREEVPFVLVESDPELVAEFEAGGSDRYFLQGDGTREGVLEQAGLSRAGALITTLPKDADNVYVVLTAKSLRPDLNIIARASQEDAIAKLRRAGANHVVWPEQAGGQLMAYIVAKPSIFEFIGLLNAPGGQGVYFTEVGYDQIRDDRRQPTLALLATREKSGASVIGLRREDGQYRINPPLESALTAECRLVLLGSTDQLSRFSAFFLKPEVTLERF